MPYYGSLNVWASSSPASRTFLSPSNSEPPPVSRAFVRVPLDTPKSPFPTNRQGQGSRPLFSWILAICGMWKIALSTWQIVNATCNYQKKKQWQRSRNLTVIIRHTPQHNQSCQIYLQRCNRWLARTLWETNWQNGLQIHLLPYEPSQSKPLWTILYTLLQNTLQRHYTIRGSNFSKLRITIRWVYTASLANFWPIYAIWILGVFWAVGPPTGDSLVSTVNKLPLIFHLY